MAEKRPRPGGILGNLMTALSDGPVPLSKLLRETHGPIGSIRNRMTEMRSNGWIVDTVTLTDEGRKALEKMS